MRRVHGQRRRPGRLSGGQEGSWGRRSEGTNSREAGCTEGRRTAGLPAGVTLAPGTLDLEVGGVGGLWEGIH